MDISVVIPCYNRRHSIGAAVESALCQSLPPSEIIVVDDGSEDDSAAVAASFGSTVRVIRTANHGASAARNRGIAESSGDWIAFLDSDDVWHPEKLSIQRGALLAFPQAALVFCDTAVKRAGRVELSSRFALGGVYGAEVDQTGAFRLHDRSLFMQMLESSRCVTSAVLVKRDLVELTFPEHLRVSEDWALWLKLVLSYPFVSVDRVLVTMHLSEDNLTRGISRIMRCDVLVLKELSENAMLSEAERVELKRVLAERAIAAVYHSLVNAEPVEARATMSMIPADAAFGPRRVVYWLAGWLPSRVLGMLARFRLGKGFPALFVFIGLLKLPNSLPSFLSL